MRQFQRMAFSATCAVALCALSQSPLAAQPAPDLVGWAPKPVELGAYTGVHKPHTKLSEVLAKHAGQQNWTETVVDDALLFAQYISMAPGASTPTRLHGDTRTWWVVQDGQIRFTIEGQEPFVASKGFLVQVPDRVPYKMETVGDVPSLRFEVMVANASTLYPLSESPVPVPGMEFVQARIPGRGTYGEGERVYLDFLTDIVNGSARGGAFVNDDRGFANIIRGQGTPRPPDTNVGHYHAYGAEFWHIMEGQIDYLIEGVPFFSATEGDIVYVPAGRFHRASFGGDGMATRLAINGYPRGLHVWPPPQD